MSKHHAILPGAIARLCDLDSTCAVVLIGSVRYGYERPESDLDLVVFVRDSAQPEAHGWRVGRTYGPGVCGIDRDLDGIDIQVFLVTDSGFGQWFADCPWNFYPFSQGEILHDPAGVAAERRLMLRRYFDNHPVLRDTWATQLESHKQFKLHGVAPADYLPLDQFAAKLKSLV